MKKILTILAAFVLTLPVWGSVPKFYPAQATFVFAEPGEEIVSGQPCEGVKYEDGTLLVKNESFRVLAVWWDGFSSKPTNYIPFELDIQGNPVPVSGAENAKFMWMQTTDSGTSQTYAPVGDIAGIAGTRYSTNPSLFWSRFSLLGETVEDELPDEYKGESYRVYLITLDTRLNGAVSPGEPTRIVKWNAVYATTNIYSMANQEYIAINFTYENFTTLPDLTPTRLPYGVEPEPEITFPEGTTEEEFEAAWALLEDKLTPDQLEDLTEITNPDAATIINGCGVDLDGTVATFTYEFKVSEIAFGESGVTVKVELGEKQSFATGVTVTLVDLEGAALTGVTVAGTKIEESGKNEATVTIQVDSDDIDTLLFKAKAMKVDQTNEESSEEE